MNDEDFSEPEQKEPYFVVMLDRSNNSVWMVAVLAHDDDEAKLRALKRVLHDQGMGYDKNEPTDDYGGQQGFSPMLAYNRQEAERLFQSAYPKKPS